MKDLLYPLVLLLALTDQAFTQGSVSAGTCEWKCTTTTVPGYQLDEDECGIGNSGEAWVNITGRTFSGDGFAADGQELCDISVQANETGYVKKVCKFKPLSGAGGSNTEPGEEREAGPSCRGLAEADVKSEAWGKVFLQDGDCEAAALGGVEITCNVTPTATAVLMDSQGATGETSVGSISMYGITINFSSDTETGTHPDDHKVRDFSGQAETDFFTYTITCEAYAYCYANGGWLGFDTAACSIEELRGEGTVTETLTAKNDPINY